jgi:hypothetical protein
MVSSFDEEHRITNLWGLARDQLDEQDLLMIESSSSEHNFQYD